MYSRYQNWKKKFTMVFISTLGAAGEASTCKYLKHWLGEECLQWKKNVDSKMNFLISGCSSSHVEAKLIQKKKGPGATLLEVIEILQVNDSTSKSLKNLDSTKCIHYAKYDKKKSGWKEEKPSNPVVLLWVLQVRKSVVCFCYKKLLL